MSLLLEMSGVKKGYPSGRDFIHVLTGVNLALKAGETVSIRGESGSGKTTLLNILSGLERVDYGTVRWMEDSVEHETLGRLAERRAKFMGLVFQAYYLIPELNVLENVILPARMIRSPRRVADERARYLLAQVGLENRWDSSVQVLSGGERQRVAIARSLMNQPKVLLADEPTGNLDEKTGRQIMELLLQVGRSESAALLLVTHNPDFAAQTDRQLHLNMGELQAV
jgi:ABC-type lipoprotein export system ATPase subunit